MRFVAILVSISLHGVLLVFLGVFKNEQRLAPAVNWLPGTVSIKLVKAGPLEPDGKVEAKPGRAGRSPASASSRGSSKAAKKASGPKLNKYTDLLPGPDWQTSRSFRESIVGKSGSFQNQRWTAIPAPVRQCTEQIEGILDIPLVFRKAVKDGKASVRLVNAGQSNLIIRTLHGEPHFRAILYEALINPENRQTFLHLFNVLSVDELVLVLRFTSKNIPAVSFGDSTAIHIARNRVVINKSRSIHLVSTPPPDPPEQGVGGGIGMPLPDREADRAVERDKMHLRRLQMSPAFHSPIYNRRI